MLTEAVVQKVHRGVADPDQAWILGELIRYLEHPRSGAMEFEDTGAAWVGVRDAVQAGTLRPNDKGAAEVASRWDQLVRYACLRLGRQLGIEVQPALSRKELAEPAVRAQALVSSLADAGRLDGGLRIPNTVGPVSLAADLRAGKLTVSVDVDAPREGRVQTRINWLVRQLKDAPEDLRIDTFVLHGRGAGASGLLRDVRANPGVLVDDPKRELRSFRLTMAAPVGTKRGQGWGSFVASVLDLFDAFYATTVQALKPWAAAPPRLRSPEAVEQEAEVAPALVSTSLSSQDGAEAGPAPARPEAGGTPPTTADDEHHGADDTRIATAPAADDDGGGGAVVGTPRPE